MPNPELHSGQLENKPLGVAVTTSVQPEADSLGDQLGEVANWLNPVRRVRALYGAVKYERASRALTNESARKPKIEHIILGNHEYEYHVYEPDPEYGIAPNEADTVLIKHGLTEFVGRGSADGLLREYALKNPAQRVVAEETKGMSHSGKPIPLNRLGDRRLEKLASESMGNIAHFALSGEVILVGVSLGTIQEAHMIAQNLQDSGENKLHIKEAYFISGADISQNVTGVENFRDPDLDEETFRKELSRSFKTSVLKEGMSIAYNNPRQIIANAENLSTFLLKPELALQRIITIIIDYKKAEDGLPWDLIKAIYDGVDIRNLGGEDDPLVQARLPQLERLDELVERDVVRRTVSGYGHLLTADINRTMKELELLKQQATLLDILPND